MESVKSKSASKDLVLTPFMPSPKIAETEEETTKKKKKRRFFWIFFVTAFVAVSFSVVGVGLYMRYREESFYMVNITIDPMVVDERGETHVSGGNFSCSDTDSAEHYLINLEVLLSYNQYFVYKCKIENRSTSDLDFSFEISTEQQTNSLISYKIDDGAETTYTQMVENLSIEKYHATYLYVFIKIDDMDLSAYIKGNFSIYVSEAGGGS